MSRLTIHADDQPSKLLSSTADAVEIAAGLAPIGVRFERWRAHAVLPPDASDDDVLGAYAVDIERLNSIGGYRSVDVIRLTPDDPAAAGLRAKFLAEHIHLDDEVRFFVEGAAQFYLHRDGKVFILVCEAGDLISIPAGTPHWFDMGARPFFTALRLFVSPEGWVANFTGAGIADVFPKFEPAA